MSRSEPPADAGAALRRAFDEGDVPGCRALLEANPSLVDGTASDGLCFLLSALHRESHGKTVGLRALWLSQGAHIDVFVAAAMGDGSRVHEMLDATPELIAARDPWEMQPLHWAAHCGHTDLVGQLLDRGADVNAAADSWSALHLAVEIGHGDTARLLIDRGADLHARLDAAHDHMTPLAMVEAWNIPAMAVMLRPFYEGV